MAAFQIVLLLMLVAGQTFAQSGIRIEDARTGDAISGANLRFLDSAGKLLGRVVTNVAGNGMLPADNATKQLIATLEVHAVGYADTLLHVPFPLVISMRSAIERQPITVTAQRRLATAQDVPVSIAVVSPAEIASKSQEKLDVILRTIPGVSVTESQVSIRGSSGYSRSVGSRVLLLLDGMPFLTADNGEMKFDALPLGVLERIEVIKGAGSALYGNSALGGVINLITREPTDGPRVAVTTTAGMYDEPKFDAWKVGELKRRFYSLEAAGSTTVEGVGLLGSMNYLRNEGYRLGDDSYRWNGFLKSSFSTGDDSRLTLAALAANEDRGGWVYWKSLNEPLLPSDSLEAINARINSSKLNIAAAYSTLLSVDDALAAKASFFRTHFTTAPKEEGALPGAHSEANSLNSEISFSTYRLSPAFVTAGIAANASFVNSDLFGMRSGTTFGGFLQSEFAPVSDVTVTAGLRADLTSQDSASSEGQVSPRIGFTYKATEDLSFRASAGSAFRAPAISERFINTRLSGFDIAPNPSLVAERSWGGEVGGSYGNEWIWADAALFHSRFSQLIEPVLTSAGSLQFQNITSASLTGHEEGIELRPLLNSDLKLRLAYTNVATKDDSTGKSLRYRPRHMIQSRVDATQWGFELAADFRYLSAYEEVEPLLAVAVKDAAVRVPAYVVDLQAGYRFANVAGAPLRIQFEARNVLNYYYVEIAGNLAPLRSFAIKLQAGI